MTNPRNDFRKYLWAVALSLSQALLAVGCTHKSNRQDVQVVADVQSKINSDDYVPNKQISISASNGVVTLSGNVNTNAARNAAANDAAQVEGVRTVVNNLQIVPAVVADQSVESAPIKPSAVKYADHSAPPQPERVSARSPRRARDVAAKDDGYAGEPNNDNAAAANAPAAPVPWNSQPS